MVSIEYSPNSRAHCQKCRSKINTGSVRVCTKSGSPTDGYRNAYTHGECYTNRKDFTKFYGFRDLCPEDQKRFMTEVQKREWFPADYVADAAITAAATVDATTTAGLAKRDATAIVGEDGKPVAKKAKSGNGNAAMAQQKQSKLTIVGLKYAEAKASTGEKVFLIREPENPYDSNAIKVINSSKRSVGHIKKEDAAPLSQTLKSINASLKAKGEIMVATGAILNAGNGYQQTVGVVFEKKPLMKKANVAAANTAELTPKASKSVVTAPVTVSTKKIKGSVSK